MRKTLTLAAGMLLLGSSAAYAQAVAPAVDPDVVGPARRAVAGAADAAGAPGVEQRIERREERRDAARAAAGNPNAAARNQARATDPDAWRMRWHNNQWWYYTPKNTWMYYNNNAWSDYDAATFVPPRTGYYTGRGFRGRYYSGYRGAYGPPATSYSNGTAPTNNPPPGGTNPSPSTQPKLNQNYQHAPRLDEDANPRPNPNPNPSSNPNPVLQPNP